MDVTVPEILKRHIRYHTLKRYKINHSTVYPKNINMSLQETIQLQLVTH